MLRRFLGALALASVLSTPALGAAQIGAWPNLLNTIPKVALTFGPDGSTGTPVDAAHPLPTGGFRETFQLATANTASAPAVLYGGDYILTQVCSSYGTVALQVLGPDGATYLLAVSYSTADTASGHGVTLGSNAQVKVTLTGTAGCNVTLSRVP